MQGLQAAAKKLGVTRRCSLHHFSANLHIGLKYLEGTGTHQRVPLPHEAPKCGCLAGGCHKAAESPAEKSIVLSDSHSLSQQGQSTCEPPSSQQQSRRVPHPPGLALMQQPCSMQAQHMALHEARRTPLLEAHCATCCKRGARGHHLMPGTEAAAEPQAARMSQLPTQGLTSGDGLQMPCFPRH
mmetsp:Transcript_52654/g.98718  ORF Transcript_52654/g.98718 Transcript_52654/m.98718 type:complete len:184 (-) Transcript_52654:412-963(-)